MNFAVAAPLAAGLTAGLLAAGLQTASSGPVAVQVSTSERTESGELTLATGDLETYRIRLLPVASFPELPTAISSQLLSRGCMIPQSFEAQQPENVIHGSFRAQGSSDWAVLCSVHGATTLYVFFAGQFDAPLALRSQADTAWLGSEPGSLVCGSAWGINTRSASNLRESRQLHGAAPFDHDGIEDARLERSTTVRYWQDGHWLAIGVQE